MQVLAASAAPAVQAAALLAVQDAYQRYSERLRQGGRRTSEAAAAARAQVQELQLRQPSAEPDS